MSGMKFNIPHAGTARNISGVIIAFVIGIVFLVISFIFMGNGINLLWLIPPALICFLVAIISIEKFLLVTVFFVPLSVQLRFIIPDVSADIFLPTELMLPVMLLLVLFKALVTREMDRRIFAHPVTLIGFCILGWSLLTSFTGTMILVSLKSVATRLWFFAGFYLLAVEIFKRRERIEEYFRAYIAGMIPVVIYFVINMWHSGLFDQKATFRAVRPFFNDHTAIGASLAFCIPVILFLIFKKGRGGFSRFIFFLILLLFSFAFVLSYSRAAWLSLAVASMVALVLALKISWKILVPLAGILVVAIVTSWSSLVLSFNENRQASSGNLSRHLRSISNISTDDSNMERINRWKSALRMSAEKPLFGWGPATYQFIYAPYQIASEKTAISTNYGEGGNAHSEYLGALADMGIPGMVLYIVLVIVILYHAVILYNRNGDRQSALLLLTLVTGLMTYIVHGALNNFLDTDKISALLWGMIAAVVSLDIEFRSRKEKI